VAMMIIFLNDTKSQTKTTTKKRNNTSFKARANKIFKKFEIFFINKLIYKHFVVVINYEIILKMKI
jgi:hypothetical protein